MEFYFVRVLRRALVNQDNDLVVIQLNRSTLYRQYAGGLIHTFESILIGFIKIQLALNLHVPLLQKRNDGSVIVEHLKLTVYAGYSD